LVLLIAVAGLVVWQRSRALPVVVTPVVRGRAVEAVYATGSVEAENRVEVKAQVGGTIAELLVREGARVKQGDLLARINNPSATFELKRGTTDLSAASAQAARDAPQLAALAGQARSISAQLSSARVELARTQALIASGGVPKAELERALSHVEQLEGSLDANAAQQRALRIDLTANVARQSAQVQSLAARVSDTEVRSPLDGVVLVRRIELGEVVSINQPLFMVGDTRSLVLEVSVDEADVARISDGKDGRPASKVAVSLLAFSKQVFKGVVFEIFPDADRTKKAFLVKVRLDDVPTGMRSGMTAEVNMITREREGLLAPASAESDGAMWLAASGLAVKRKVQVGIRDPLRIEVLEGLSEGDLVIVQSKDKLREGAHLLLERREPDKLEPMPDSAQPRQTSL
jgi:multidrug efflux pump subunit AcrA (membrane-fusion protein)